MVFNLFHSIDKNILLKVYDPSKAEEPIKVVVRKSEKFLDRVENQTIGRYPMTSNVRGLVLIITLIAYEGNLNRTAAEHDERNLRELFQQMGFTVFSYKNLTVAVSNYFFYFFSVNIYIIKTLCL